MSNAKSDAPLSLKIMINKQKTKVLFAEADSDFADVLLSFLTLPLGKIARVLENHYGDKAPVFGSLSTLYKSLVNLDNARFVTEAAQMMLMNPWSSFEDDCRNLKLDISDSRPPKYYTCSDYWCDFLFSDNICMYYGSASCDCGKTLNKREIISDPPAADGEGVFTKNTASFIVYDNLRMVPYATGFLQTLRNLGIRDAHGAELRIVNFGIGKVIELLKCCLLSETPLTDLILNNSQNSSCAARQSESLLSFHQIEKKEAGNSKNITLKVTVQKSTKKLLFAQGEADFVELLFSFLTIPLGGVEFLLKNNTCLKNVDNLYRSLSDAIDDKYFKTPVTKNRLMNPKLPHGYTSKNQFLPLSEESAPTLYYEGGKFYYNKQLESNVVSYFRSPKGQGNFVKEESTYMITDDLTVTPFCMTLGLNILDRLNIPLCDVGELEVPVGLEEALRILKASLTSTFALTNGLANHILYS
ncbi:hypothetical protein C2S52_011746 [Perilla frutescens var. hirtella]|nr:hypothetical protein C2S52_011746 [Perilla frutescens var. hirtella]KAH6785628.1 hypothetical protein C2S51_038083 [Perilla frutescens var. frutescens]